MMFLLLLSLLAWALPSCLGGETCSISQGSTTITAFCETSCCSTKCCTHSETEGISTVAIVLSVFIVIIAILLIVVLVVVSYRKKKPACCYKPQKEEEEDKEKVLEDEENSSKDLIDENKKKEGSVDECSSGYSSSQSVKSINNSTKKAPAARPASPFGQNGSPIISRLPGPAMSMPRSTFMPPPAGLSFANPAFDKNEDKTEILNKKPKSVTFQNNKIDSPRGSISISPTESQRPHYPPILPPLYNDEKTSSDLFATSNKSNNSPTEKSANGKGHNKSHRKSYPTDRNKIGMLWDDNEVKPKATIFKTSSASPPPSKMRNSIPSTDSPTSPNQPIFNTFEIVQIPKKPVSSRRNDTNYNAKDSAYSPTIIQVADSKDSVDSIEADENRDTKNAQRTNSSSSPYTTTPYTIKKNKRVLGTANGFSQSANSSPLVTRSGDLSARSSGDLGNGSTIFVSSFMQQRTAAKNWDSPV